MLQNHAAPVDDAARRETDTHADLPPVERNGVGAARALIASGGATPDAMAALVDSGVDAAGVLAFLQETLGNGFVAAVTSRLGGGGEAATPESVAAAGVQGDAVALPHADAIARSFGPAHDVAAIPAHVGGPASAAAAELGATAYATGGHVAFAGSPDLHTAAHEAAHVVQQRAGVALAGGAGRDGDVHERHADAVADRVVRGESAADLLPAGGAGHDAGAAGELVQRRVWIGARQTTEAQLVQPPAGLGEADAAVLAGKSAGTVAFAEIWGSVRTAACKILGVETLDEGMEARLRNKLTAWCDQISGIENKLRHKKGVAPQSNPDMADDTEERVYQDIDGLTTALLHESDPGYAGKLEDEAALAAQVKSDPSYAAAAQEVVAAVVGSLSDEDLDDLALLASQSRYGAFSQLAHARELASSGDVSSLVIFLDEYTEYSDVKNDAGFKAAKLDMLKTFGDFRSNGWTVNESNEWVQKMRARGVPLQAGPSGTSNRVLALARAQGAAADVVARVGWVLFAFFNGMWRGYSGTHRLAEVMAVAELHCPAVMNFKPSRARL